MLENENLNEIQKPQLSTGAVRRSLLLTNEKLWEMAKLITDRQRKAKEQPTDVAYWDMLEEMWFDWLEEELCGNDA
jgi:cytochrome c-type biogenesis protein CcmH/NrfG